MVNAARTLLRNAPAAAEDAAGLGEFVPAGYVPATLGGPLGRARLALFGPEDPGRRDRRLRAFLAVLHGDPLLERFVLASDPRVTYDPLELPAALPGIAEPADALPAILAAADGLDEEALLALFGADAAEPYASLRALWARTEPLQRRLGAALLALALRTAERGGRA